MSPENTFHADRLHESISHRHAKLIRETLTIISPGIWSAEPKVKTDAILAEHDEGKYIRRTMKLTRATLLDLATLSLRKEKSREPSDYDRTLIREEVIFQNEQEEESSYVILHSGIILDRASAMRVLTFEASPIYCFLLDVAERLSTW
jgi:hypothetical protein